MGSSNPVRRTADRPPLLGWDHLPLFVLPAGVLLAWKVVGAGWPRWIVMSAMAVAFFAGCKWLTWRCAKRTKAPAWLHAAYLFLWPGLDADTFLNRDKNPAKPRATAWLVALLNIALGVTLFWVLARRWPENSLLLRGWTGMVGFILAVHCGLFQLLSCAWRAAGVDARPLMEAPLLSQSASEFWGRRWNTAFRDAAHRFLFQPLAPRFGARWAMLIIFIVSGVIHEAVVTIPAGGGYGGPTLFFTLQGAAILFERSKMGRALGLGRGVRGWAFAMTTLAATVFFAFPPPFVKQVMLPLMRSAGAF